MASYIDDECLTLTDGQPMVTTPDVDSDKGLEKRPLCLSGCRLGHSKDADSLPTELLHQTGKRKTSRCYPITTDYQRPWTWTAMGHYVEGTLWANQVVPECEVFLNGEGSSESKLLGCVKNPGHKQFIPVRQFNTEHLPEELRAEGMLETIMDSIHRTVLIKVKYTSMSRPDTFHDSKAPYPYSKYKGSDRVVRIGTGFITSVKPSFQPEFGECPCHECVKSGNHQNRYWKYKVITAAHVVFDDLEAQQTIVTCFYDSDENPEEIVTLHGVKIDSVQYNGEMYRSDTCDNLICVTHDDEYAERIKIRIGHCIRFDSLKTNLYGFIVSHPHGSCKMISFGKVLYTITYFKTENKVGKCEKFPKNTVCYSSIGSIGGEFICHYLNANSLRKCRLKLRGLFKTTKDYYHKRATFTLPDNAECSIKYHHDKKGFSFPPGTIFKSGGAVIPIQDNAIFQSKNVWDDLWMQDSSQVYDIPTCPGSSGATVPRHQYDEDMNIMHPFTPHSGWDRQGQCNRSCITKCNIGLKYWVDAREHT